MSNGNGTEQNNGGTVVIADPTTQLGQQPPQIEVSPLLAYLSTDFGHTVTMKVLALIEDIKKGTLDKTSEQSAKQLELHHKSLMRWWMMQTVILVASLSSVGILAWHGKLDATVAALIGTIVGFVFGRKQ